MLLYVSETDLCSRYFGHGKDPQRDATIAIDA
jgi:hypothetical protein